MKPDQYSKISFKSDRFIGKDRKGDRSLRLFNCKALLSDSPVTTRAVTGSFGKDDSSTYLLAKSEAPSFVIETPNSEIRLDSNLDLEVSIAYSDIEATSAYEARSIFEDQLQPYLDRLSFLHNVPIHMGQVVVADKINELQFLFFQSPPRRSQIAEGEEKFSARMMPIYALYRESQNTTSPYYRLLSLYKIMEGLLNSLRAEVLKELRRHKLDTHVPKLTVPDLPDTAGWLKQHVGKPIGPFVNDFLTNEYRNAIAHFELRGGRVMDIGRSSVRHKTADVAYLADACARVLINAHEALVARLP